MAFRGKEWVPPVRAEVAAHIKDKLTLTELSPDLLSKIMETATITDGSITPEEAEEQIAEALTTAQASLENANASYYTNLRNFVKTVKNVETVNIVLPVFNSINLTSECIDAVLKNTYWPFHLTIVDDASDEMTNQVLQQYADTNPEKITLLTNRKNKGFAASVNRGIKEFELSTKYTVLLNSDVLVTPYWLTKMVVALNSNPRNKIVNPITNNTSVINVNMSPGFSYQAMNDALEKVSARNYPEIMPTGFCFLMPNSLFSAIGYFDESYQNFGEETDFWMRTLTYSDGKTFERWRAVLADDAYVFHQRGASYESLGEEIHKGLRKTASERFQKQWPVWPVWKKNFNIPKTMAPLRKAFSASLLKDKGTPICFVTHSVESCGGMHFIADIVNLINKNGGDARVALIKRDDKKPAEPAAELQCSPMHFDNSDDFLSFFRIRMFDKGIVVAATSELAPVVAELAENNPRIVPVLHVQSYEPALVTDSVEAEKLKANFNIIPTVISSSHWITKELPKPPLATINPGIDRKLFYKGDRNKGDERPTVLIALNGAYPFKGSNRGVDLALNLLGLAKHHRKDIRVMAYGAYSIAGVSNVMCLGAIPRTRIASLLANEVDVFVDPAHNHSYGMPALEAIACGSLVMGWDNKGIREYLPKGYSPNTDLIVPDETPVEVVARRVFAALMDEDARKKEQELQYRTAMIDYHDRQKNVAKMAETLQGLVGIPKLNIVVVTPHLRKHGGPTTIVTMANELAARGHKVKVASVYSDLNPSVVAYTDLPIVLLNQSMDNFPECDLVITNSDNPLNKEISATPKAKRKIMLKLSHNPRFKQLEEEGLNLKWDAIVTSSQWLADVCENPGPDWNYAPVKATRVGWFHYNFDRMRRSIKRKKFNILNDDPIIISTLVHAHGSKGSAEAGAIFEALNKHYKGAIRFIGVGEIYPTDVKIKIENMDYVFSPSRDELADIMAKTDIWLGCSHTEGLGRMALEVMTGVAACVLTDTGAEYVADGQNALVRPIGDLDGLANACNALIADVELRKQIASAGYRTAQKMSDPTRFMDNLEKVIADVL